MNANKEVHICITADEVSEEKCRENLLHELNSIIEDSNLFHKTLAIDMCVSEAVISYYLNGSRPITVDRLCAVCIAMRLDPHEQRRLFTVAGWAMPDYDGRGTVREQMIRHYMDFCRKDHSLTVKRCNGELRRKGYEPLTAKRGKRS